MLFIINLDGDLLKCTDIKPSNFDPHFNFFLASKIIYILLFSNPKIIPSNKLIPLDTLIRLPLHHKLYPHFDRQ